MRLEPEAVAHLHDVWARRARAVSAAALVLVGAARADALRAEASGGRAHGPRRPARGAQRSTWARRTRRPEEVRTKQVLNSLA